MQKFNLKFLPSRRNILQGLLQYLGSIIAVWPAEVITRQLSGLCGGGNLHGSYCAIRGAGGVGEAEIGHCYTGTCETRQMVFQGPSQFSTYNPLVLGFLSAAAPTQPEIMSAMWRNNILSHNILSCLFCYLSHTRTHTHTHTHTHTPARARARTVISRVCKVITSKFVPVHAMKAYGGRRCVASLILNLNTRWKCVVTFTHRQPYRGGKKSGYPLN
jgi:hypothetical protein